MQEWGKEKRGGEQTEVGASGGLSRNDETLRPDNLLIAGLRSDESVIRRFLASH
jgi:hypothetical protein